MNLNKTYISDKRYSQTEEEGAESNSELPPVLEELVWPVVHNAGDEGLKIAKHYDRVDYLPNFL